jgi:hypothetical protein
MSAQAGPDELLFTAARAVPFFVALALALMRTKSFSDSQFLQPALSALKQVELRTKPVAKGFVLCNEVLVKPFVDMTITRISIAGYLISLLIGLASLIPIAISRYGYLGTTALSMFIYCFCFLVFFGHLVVVQKEVFSWSTSVVGKLVTASLFGYATVFLADRVQDMDLFFMVLKPYAILRIGQYGDFASLHLVIIIAIFLVLFPFLRMLKRSRWPSLGTRLETWTADGKEFNVDDAFSSLNPKDRIMFSKDFIQSQVNEMIYRDKLVIIAGDQCPLKPGEIRYRKK